MERRRKTIAHTAGLLFWGGLLFGQPLWANSDQGFSVAPEAEIESLVEQAPGQADLGRELLAELTCLRQNHGLVAGLRPETELAQVAREYAAYLAQRGRLGHVDHQGYRAVQRLARRFPRLLLEGRAPLEVGEVLALGSDAKTIAQAWMDSPGHRRLILDDRWSGWGLGLAPWQDDHWVVVLLFR